MPCRVEKSDNRTLWSINLEDQNQVTIPKVEESRSELSFAQERLWLIGQYGQGTNAYQMPEVYELDITTDIAGIKYAVQQIVARHEVLRSTIEKGVGGNGLQQVHEGPLLIEDIALTDKEDYKTVIREDINRPFDLGSAYPIRVKFYFLSSDEAGGSRTFLLINIHPIVSDVWSTSIFRQELFAYYIAWINKDDDFRLPDLEIQYKDYATWQGKFLTGAILEKQLSYWKNKLSGYQPLKLPTDYPRPPKIDQRGASQAFIVDGDTSRKLRSLTRQWGVTIHSLMLSSINILLSKYTGQEDIVTGSPLAGRHYKQTERLIGLFANTRINRTILDKSQSFGELVKQVHGEQIQAQLHQDIPFEKLVAELGEERDMTRHPVFQVMFVMDGISKHAYAGEQQKPYIFPCRLPDIYEVEKFDLSILIDDTEQEIKGQFSYAASLFNKDTIARLIGYYTHLLDQLAKAPERPYGIHKLLNREEEQYLIETLNNTASDYPLEKTIVDIFEEQVRKTPDNTAVVFEDRELSYSELNGLSNRLASYLRRNYDIMPDDLVGIKLERSDWMIVAMLGILKSGGAYVPIDPAYPQERIDFMTKDSGCRVLIDEAELENFKGTRESYDATNCDIGLLHEHLVYCMYTSGSTGAPKGVLIEHRSLVNVITSQKQEFGINADDRVLQLSTINFDASAEQIWLAFTSGATLVVAGKELLADATALEQYIIDQKISHIHSVASFLNVLEISDCSSIKRIRSDGEICGVQVASKWKNKCRFYNGYGLTETTITSLRYPVRPDVAHGSSVPIGKPVSNVQVYLLDGYLDLVPYGVPGEICIGGAGLARGYLNRAELTAEKFIENPYRPGQRLYRTGDLGSWMPDGNVAYLGRMDDQVKIRGHRIETGEIAHTLQKHSGVLQAVVTAQYLGGPEQELIAYTTGTATAEALRDYLRQMLPPYMVPGYYVQLERMPLMANGKMNKRALPLPNDTGLNSGKAYVAPATETETALVRIWSAVLNLEEKNISTDADFFDLGGHSLKVIRLQGLVQREFGARLLVRELFTCRTILAQSKLILSKSKNSYEPIQPVMLQPYYQLSAAQRRLWVLSRIEGAARAYNTTMAVLLEGPLDEQAFDRAFRDIVGRHEVLRTVFRTDESGNPYQLVMGLQEYAFKGTCTDLSTDPSSVDALIAGEISRVFDLKEPLLRCHLIKLGVKRHVWVTVMPHIITDEWSLGIFLREFSSLYSGYVQGREMELPPLRMQYKDYAAWHNRQLASGGIAVHRRYWLEQFSGHIPVLDLATDYPRPEVKTYNGSAIASVIGKEVISGFKRQSKERGGTLFMHLLSCVYVLLYRYTGQEDIVIGCPSAGREHPDLEGQIGYYINTLALRTRFSGAGSYAQLYESVKEVAMGAYEHQVYPYDKLLDALQIRRDMSRNPLFDVWVDLHNTEQGEQAAELWSLSASAYELPEHKVAKFDQTLIFKESGEGLLVYLEYNTDIYSHSRAEHMLEQLKRIAASVALDPEQRLSEIKMLSEEEERYILEELNDTKSDYPRDKTIVDLFDEQVRKTPHNIAVVFEDGEMSYSELNGMSNRLAAYLKQNYEIGPDDLVGIKLGRSEWMIVAILGVLKSGGAYVPIDPDYPQERIEYMVQDSRCNALLNEAELEYFKLVMDFYDSEGPDVGLDAQSLAYCIYTSGSTGRPKGVLVEHKAVVNYIEWAKTYAKDVSKTEVDMFSTLSFDFTVTSIYGALLSGKKLRIHRQHTELSEQLNRIISNSENEVIKLTPAHIQLLDEGIIRKSIPRSYVIGGEPLREDQISILRSNKGARIYNEYGPTEATVGCVVKEIGDDNKALIGKPIANTRVYLLDHTLRLVPLGVAGELCIGGDGLARGYLNRADLTAEKFIENPYKPGERIYRSGDLARWLPDGNLEYLGRTDDQVKIRGYRIEPGEIEHALLSIRGIKQCCVLAKERRTENGGDKYLVGYYVPDCIDETLSPGNILEKLSRVLPEYMVPVAMVAMESFPLTINGKLDKQALSDPDFSSPLDEYVAPADETESETCRIWQRYLELERVGVTDDFFRIGGNSILAIQVTHHMTKILGCDVKVGDLFRLKNIKELLKYVYSLKATNDFIIKKY